MSNPASCTSAGNDGFACPAELAKSEAATAIQLYKGAQKLMEGVVSGPALYHAYMNYMTEASLGLLDAGHNEAWLIDGPPPQDTQFGVSEMARHATRVSLAVDALKNKSEKVPCSDDSLHGICYDKTAISTINTPWDWWSSNLPAIAGGVGGVLDSNIKENEYFTLHPNQSATFNLYTRDGLQYKAELEPNGKLSVRNANSNAGFTIFPDGHMQTTSNGSLSPEPVRTFIGHKDGFRITFETAHDGKPEKVTVVTDLTVTPYWFHDDEGQYVGTMEVLPGNKIEIHQYSGQYADANHIAAQTELGVASVAVADIDQQIQPADGAMTNKR